MSWPHQRGIGGARRRLSRPALIIVLALGCIGSPPVTAQQKSTTTDSVWCHDADRSLVIRKQRWRCEGEIVSDAEAKRIKAERVRRIQGVLARERRPLVPDKRLAGTGTGFAITARGDVLTNHHVVKDCGAVTVTLAGKDERVAKVRGSDPRRDLALLNVDVATPGAAQFAMQRDPSQTRSTTVVGYPLHGRVVVKPRMVTGRFHNEGQPNNPNVFAMKIDIRRGNSGGPVLDETGRVIGVVFAKVDTPSVYAKTGKLIRHVGLGIRLPVVRDFLSRYGMTLTDATTEQALEPAARFERARQFVAQIRCYR